MCTYSPVPNAEMSKRDSVIFLVEYDGKENLFLFYFLPYSIPTYTMALRMACEIRFLSSSSL